MRSIPYPSRRQSHCRRQTQTDSKTANRSQGINEKRGNEKGGYHRSRRPSARSRQRLRESSALEVDLQTISSATALFPAQVGMNRFAPIFPIVKRHTAIYTQSRAFRVWSYSVIYLCWRRKSNMDKKPSMNVSKQQSMEIALRRARAERDEEGTGWQAHSSREVCTLAQ